MSSGDFRNFNELARLIFQNDLHPESPPPTSEVSQPRKGQEACLCYESDDGPVAEKLSPDELDWGTESLSPEKEQEALLASRSDGWADFSKFAPDELDWGAGGFTPEEEQEALVASRSDDWDNFFEFSPDETVWEAGGALPNSNQESTQPSVASDQPASCELVPCALQPEFPQPSTSKKILGSGFSEYNTFNIAIDRSLSVISPNTEERQSDYFSGFQGEERAYKDTVGAIDHGRPTAKKVSEKLKKIFLLKVFRHCLYIYNGRFYQYYDKKDALIFIYAACDDEVTLTGNSRILEETYELLLIDPGLIVDEERVTSEYLSFENGLLRLSDSVLCPHTESIFLTSGINANYIPGLSLGPVSRKFFEDVACGDPDHVKRNLQAIGLSLTPDMAAKKLILLQGIGDSGKTVETNLITELYSKGCVASIRLDMIGERFQVAGVIGKGLCILPDTVSTRLKPSAVSVLKQLTGNDLVPAEIKYGPTIEFYNTATLVAVTNHPLLLEQYDEAFANRLVVIPFRCQVPEDQKNRCLLAQLLAERDSIVSVAMAEYFDLRANHYRFSGDYQVNEGMFSNPDGPSLVGPSAEELVKKFLLDQYEASTDGFVQTTDAYTEFSKVHPNVSRAEFSPCFYGLTKELFGCDQSRKRKPSQKNALPCVIGLAHR